MKPLSNELLSQYDLKIKKYQYAKSHYYLDTPKGTLILRKSVASKEQIEFEYELGRDILKKGFPYVNPIFLTKKKTPYAAHQDKLYILQPYVAGEEIDFQNVDDLNQIIEILAKFHLLARDLDIGTRTLEEVMVKNPYENFYKRYVESQKLKKGISKTGKRTAFEAMFVKDYRVYEELMEMALEKIDAAVGERLIQIAKEHKTIAHNDYSYHTLEKIGQDRYKMTNLDCCGYNMQIMDMAYVLTKIMQKNNWNIDLLRKLIGSYEKHRPLSSDEMNMLKALLIFPEKYAKICNRYLNSKRRNNYSMFETKWENMLVYQQDQIEAATNIYRYL